MNYKKQLAVAVICLALGTLANIFILKNSIWNMSWSMILSVIIGLISAFMIFPDTRETTIKDIEYQLKNYPLSKESFARLVKLWQELNETTDLPNISPRKKTLKRTIIGIVLFSLVSLGMIICVWIIYPQKIAFWATIWIAVLTASFDLLIYFAKKRNIAKINAINGYI